MGRIPEILVGRSTIEAQFVSQNVPEEFKNTRVTVWDLECQGDNCEWTDWAKTLGEAEELECIHIKWHDEGMQE